MIIAERLRGLRREQGITKRDLVNRLPLNYSTYANYESGFREPNSEVLQMLARYFNVSIDYLMGITANRRKADEIAVLTDDEHEHISQYRLLDNHGREMVDLVLQKEVERLNFPNAKSLMGQRQAEDGKLMLKVYQQRASAGLGNYLSDDSDMDYEEMYFVANRTSEKADFCVRIKGDSMEPRICDGDIVFVKAMPKVEPDSIGIFYYEGEMYCKRLRIDNRKGAIYLESLNKSYAPKQIENPEYLQTIGELIGIAERDLS